MLSIGFLASAALTALGLIIYAVISFQRRVIELGVLRAIGLGYRQMVALLVVEQVVTILCGVLMGVPLGIAASLVFVPYYQVGRTQNDLIPPFRVLLAWDEAGAIVAGLVVILLLGTVGIIWRANRLRVFEALKLGDTG